MPPVHGLVRDHVRATFEGNVHVGMVAICACTSMCPAVPAFVLGRACEACVVMSGKYSFYVSYVSSVAVDGTDIMTTVRYLVQSEMKLDCN